MLDDSSSYHLVDAKEAEKDVDNSQSTTRPEAVGEDLSEDEVCKNRNEEPRLSRSDAHDEPQEELLSRQVVVLELPASMLSPNNNDSVDGRESNLLSCRRLVSRGTIERDDKEDDNVSIAPDSYASSPVLHAVSTIQLTLERQGEAPHDVSHPPTPGSNVNVDSTPTSVAEEPFARTTSCTSSSSDTVLVPRNLDGDDESWSNVSASWVHATPSYPARNARSSDRNEQDDDWSSYAGGASSTISGGFECSSFDGNCQRRCNRCTLLNRAVDDWCDGCGPPLLVNPCSDIDKQIATDLRQKEERDEVYQRIQQEENSRRLLVEQLLLKQSRALADVVQKYITKFLRRNSKWNGILGANNESCIHRTGFPLHAKYSTNIKAAYHSTKDYYKIHETKKISARAMGNRKRLQSRPHVRNRLEICQDTIEEETKNDDDDCRDRQCRTKVDENEDEADFLGWIALTAATDGDMYEGWNDGDDNTSHQAEDGCETTSDAVNSSDEGHCAIIMSLSQCCQSLPLVCFDASLRRHDIMERLVRGLQSTCDKFFHRFLMKPTNQQESSNGNEASTTDAIVPQTKALEVSTNSSNVGDTAVPAAASEPDKRQP